jgi:hypothetical protein
MADQHSTPRYGLRKRKDPNPQGTSKGTHPCLSSRDTASTAIEPANTGPETAIPADSTSSNVDTSAHTAGQPIQEPSKNTTLTPHQLTIGGRTFIGPTPPTGAPTLQETPLICTTSIKIIDSSCAKTVPSSRRKMTNTASTTSAKKTNTPASGPSHSKLAKLTPIEITGWRLARRSRKRAFRVAGYRNCWTRLVNLS